MTSSKRRKGPSSGVRSATESAGAGAVADKVHSAAIRLLRALRVQDDRWGLSAPRLSALSVVVFGGPITLGDLARAEQVRPPTMTRLVQALESKRLVKRAPDANDKRQAWITATPAGRRLLLKGRQARVAALTSVLESLSEEELRILESAGMTIEEVALRIRRSGKPS